MTETNAARSDTRIRPFRVEIPQADLEDLADRLARTRWPQQLPGVGWRRGVPVGYLTELADYWRGGYDWRAEARLNRFPQFTTTVDRQTIHFLHVRSPEPDALPLLVTHGYPGSIVEFTNVIGPLTDRAAHGGDPADAFHVVAPSVPEFGFSRPVEEAGWALSRTASAFAELMRRLGDDRYAAHGGDIGAGVSGMLGGVDAEHVVGTHVNADPTALALIEGLLPDDVSGFTDEWADSTVELPDGAVDRDQLLTNVSVYWFTGTGTGASAAQFIYEATHASDWPPSSVPQGWAVFADDGILRRVVDPGAQIEHWSEFDRGGHFPAMEVPDLLVGDVRTFFRRVR